MGVATTDLLGISIFEIQCRVHRNPDWSKGRNSGIMPSIFGLGRNRESSFRRGGWSGLDLAWLVGHGPYEWFASKDDATSIICDSNIYPIW